MTTSADNSRRIAAFFDLDRTLIDVNSAKLYARHEHRQGRISTWQLVESFYWMALYHLSFINMERAYNKALAHYRGLPDEVLDARTIQWFHEQVAHRIQPGALDALAQHRAEGHLTVILTNNSCYQARVAIETWQIDDWIANHFTLDAQGRLAGRVDPPVCYGDGKVTRSEAWAERHDVDLAASFFYSDSFSDVPMFERVGHARVVNPDFRLRRIARHRGWPILDWTGGKP